MMVFFFSGFCCICFLSIYSSYSCLGAPDGFLGMLLCDNFFEAGVGTLTLKVMKQSGQKSHR